MSLAASVLAPADVLRAAVLRRLNPVLAKLYADRPRRVWWLGVLSVTLAFVLTGVAPLWSLALGPVLLGVPHLLADVRYLVVRPGLLQNGGLVALGGAPLLATSFGAPPWVGLLAVLPAVALVRPATGTTERRAGATGSEATPCPGSGQRADGQPAPRVGVGRGAGGARWRLPLVLAGWAALTACALLAPLDFTLGLVHAHNLVAVALWWWLSPRTPSAAWVPALVLLGTVAILVGGLDPVVTALGAWSAPASGASFTDFVLTHASPTVNPTLAARLVLSFCFLQAVHYAVWLRLIPDDARERPAPRTFRASWRALVADFGLAPLLAITGLALLVAAWGAWSLPGARLGYLRLAAFHGYLELAVGARWLVWGRP